MLPAFSSRLAVKPQNAATSMRVRSTEAIASINHGDPAVE